MRRYSYSILILCLALTTVVFPQEKTKAADKEAAEKAATDWLKLVDFDAYGRAWAWSSSTFKASVTPGNFEKTLRSTRATLGAVLSRQLKSVEYRTQLPGVPDGQYVVIKYDTTFEHKKGAVETVVPAFDKDGHWRVGGYSIK